MAGNKKQEQTDATMGNLFKNMNPAALKKPGHSENVDEASPVDNEYIQELKNEIDELRQQVNGALVKTDRVYRFRRVKLTPIGLDIPDDGINEQEAAELGWALSSLSGALNFWLGDWANLYLSDRELKKGAPLTKEERGELYEELIKDFGLDSSRSLRQYASVCRTLSPSIRIDGLSFSHHQLAAFLPEELKGREQEFLQRAVGLTVEKFRALIKAEQEKLLPGTLTPSFDPAPHLKDFKAVTKLFSLSGDAKLPKKKKADYLDKIQSLRQILDDLEARLGS
jgi:hypothetical protein